MSMKILIKRKSDISLDFKEKVKDIFNLYNKSDDTICGRCLLYELMDGNIDEIIYNENGKPLFKNKNIYFNISHSDDYICCAVSDMKIGIDIQKIRKVPRIDLVFSKDELELDDIELIEIWTKKEAVLKALGLNMKYMKDLDLNSYKIDTKNIDDNYILSICEISK